MFDLISDLHKEVYGFRPTQDWWVDWNNSSDSQKEKIWDEYNRVNELQIVEATQREEKNLQDFKSNIAKMMFDHNLTKLDAVRWWIEAEGLNETDLMYGSSYINYSHNLPYQNDMNEIIDEACSDRVREIYAAEEAEYSALQYS